MITLRVSLLAFMLALSPSFSPAAEPAASVGDRLPPDLRALLIQEMGALLAATQSILDALVRGDDETVAREAQAIHDSFILKKQMTPEQRRILKSSVPESFIHRDQAFHELSARLTLAAREGDRDRQYELFADLIESCAGCHARHAAGRFEAFRPQGTSE